MMMMMEAECENREAEQDDDDVSDQVMMMDSVELSVCGCGSSPLLWKLSQIRLCREEVGVVGTLVGSLARQPRQNVRLGRPLQILQEEARLLLETRGATVSHNNQQQVLEQDERHIRAVELYRDRLESSYQEQCVLALENKKAVLQRVIQEKQKDDSSNKDDVQRVMESLESLEKSFTFPRSAMAVQLCTARAGFNHCPEERAFLTSDCPMPTDQRSETRFRVYRDLRRKGFFLTSAGKFGGDYLVYPGDPLRFHAHFIALCYSLHEEASLYDILAIARLGSNVKKTVLLCSPQEGADAEGEVVYSSLQWSGLV